MNNSTSESLSLSEHSTLSVTDGFVWLASTAVIAICFPIFYRKIRRKFPITVNCWFCNRYARVAYDDANCWDCPFCEQYNGFNKDGGYNKEIKAQHSPSLNCNLLNGSAKNPNSTIIGKESSNGLCRLCNINQQLKIQQLARFVPLNEKNYDQEVEQFREQLEKSYRLCSQCERTLAGTLQKQQYNLLKNQLNVQKGKNQFVKLNNINHYDWKVILLLLKGGLCSGLKLISGIISFMIFLSFVFHLETEQQFLKATLPDLCVLDFQPILQGFLFYLKYSYNMKKEMVSIGLLCYALSSFFRRVNYDHPSLLLFWGILYALSWSDMTGLQVFVSAVCVVLSTIEIRQSPNYVLKKLSSVETVNVKATVTESSGDMDRNNLPESEDVKTQHRRTPQKSNVNESEELLELFNGAEVEEFAKEIPSNRSAKLNSKSPKKQISESGTPQLRSSKVFSKEFLATLDSERIEKELSPPPEIFNNLNNLRISNSCKASEKPSNFLFENHNFEEKCKKTSPIIKSPKFVKPSASCWVNGELNETISRSSTPSSGYSSQKADKAESRQSYHFPKAISPVPFGRSTPPEHFDFWDRSHPCFNTSNFHYFSPGYLPFQQFSNPLGHTTVYTYTRPTNYPFAFPPSSYSPHSHTPRLSDASESENLFQNASSSFQSKRKWSTIKSCLYNLSIFFNVVSTCVLAYFTWSGIISLTGN